MLEYTPGCLWVSVLKEDRTNSERRAKRRRCSRVAYANATSCRFVERKRRYEDYGKELLRITDRHDRDMLYGPTNEEQITEIFRSHVKSYKSLPMNLYHIQWKFRDEVRPRFGVMRGREFLMKDAYSFDLNYRDAVHSYNKMFLAYLKTYERMGLKAIPMMADSGAYWWGYEP